MSHCSHKVIFTVYLLSILMQRDTGTTKASSIRKFTGYRDVSEYCKRRVLPSVFLGRHVFDANSQILQFSKMELPYSCSISVRAESGSNIILVIQFQSDYTLLNSCNENKQQLVVYELGETYGGYWGALPDSIMKQDNNFTQFYTLHTTQPSTTAEESDEDESDDEMQKETVSYKLTTKKENIEFGDYIEVEVPLLNVSGNFSIHQFETGKAKNALEILDDEKPRNDVAYETSILPLLQFSMITDANRYDFTSPSLSSVTDHPTFVYTPDSRSDAFYSLRYGYKYRRTRFRKTKKIANRRFNNRLSTHVFPGIVTAKESSKALKDTLPQLTEFTIAQITKSQEIIDNIMQLLRKTTRLDSHNLFDQKFFDMQNSSLYLSRNISYGNNLFSVSKANKKEHKTEHAPNFPTSINTAQIYNYSTTPTKTYNSSLILRTAKFETNIKTEESFVKEGFKSSRKSDEPFIINVLPDEITVRSNHSTDTRPYEKNKSEDGLFKDVNGNATDMNMFKNNSKFVTGSLVNHESWENVVRAAPVMAVILNETIPLAIEEKIDTMNKKNKKMSNINNNVDKKLKRKKRYIQPLMIKNAMPRKITSPKDTKINLKHVEEFVNVQDIAHMVELKDDEIQERVALRYLRNYVGSILFNICDKRETKSRHVYLLNTSRIVISLTNFTLERMTLVMTPARTLRNKETSCPSAYLECQISGARACIDSMSACDGIPNCGAYDIYDEDRLMCGIGTGLQHSVYLAAGTFLTVLLIVLYSVHYWLKRCVPRVSEAFFVYTDRSENFFNLESIMQSPNGNDDAKYDYGGQFFDDDNLDVDQKVKLRCKLFRKLCIFCTAGCFKRRPKKIVEVEEVDSIGLNSYLPNKARRMYSFTELELSKISPKKGVDACMQTRDSLEKTTLKIQKRKYKRPMDLEGPKKNEDEKQELNVIKFLKDSKSESMQSIPVSEQNKKERLNKNNQSNWDPNEERELLSTVYETKASCSHEEADYETISSIDMPFERNEPAVRKHLRFDEEATTIPSILSDDEIDSGEEKQGKPQVILGTEKLRYSGADNVLLQNTNSGAGKEFIRFWTGTKGKKTKPKKHATLRQ